jgi:polyphosphate kinase
LYVRGICQLVPGVKGLSENIAVVSIVDSFLEHSRILYFQNAGAEEIYLSSADWMPRNLERRIELMFPIEDDNLKKRIINLLGLYARDNCKAHALQSDGRWERQTPKRKAIRVQQELREEANRLAETAEPSSHKRFTVRRKPPR